MPVTNAARRNPDTLLIGPEDLEVHEVEHQSACATAIAIASERRNMPRLL